MTTITFDTLKFVQTLRQSGVEEKQAEAIAVAVRETHDSAELATKHDIETLRRDIRESEMRMTIKMGAFMSAAVGIIVALVKLL